MKSGRKRIEEAIKASLAEPKDPMAWAKRLREREEAGERLSAVQQEMWRDALSRKSAETA